MGGRRPFEPGDRVRLTGRFLKSTGQALGGEGLSVWTVIDCKCGLCKLGNHIATNETGIDGTPRHIARANLSRFGKPTVLDDHVSPEVIRLLFQNGDEYT